MTEKSKGVIKFLMKNNGSTINVKEVMALHNTVINNDVSPTGCTYLAG